MRLHTLVLVAIATATVAYAKPPRAVADPMAIAVPPKAVIAFEVDARDSDLLGLLKNMVEEFARSPMAKAGSMPSSLPLDVTKLGALLKDVHRVHIVNYLSSEPAITPNKLTHEDDFKLLGLKRMLYIPTGSGFVLAMGKGRGGMALVVAEGAKVTVVRTDGPLDLPMLGKVAATVIPGFAMAKPMNRTVPTTKP